MYIISHCRSQSLWSWQCFRSSQEFWKFSKVSALLDLLHESLQIQLLRILDCATAAAKHFENPSRVSVPLKSLCKITVELIFENFWQRHCSSQALLKFSHVSSLFNMYYVRSLWLGGGQDPILTRCGCHHSIRGGQDPILTSQLTIQHALRAFTVIRGGQDPILTMSGCHCLIRCCQDPILTWCGFHHSIRLGSRPHSHTSRHYSTCTTCIHCD